MFDPSVETPITYAQVRRIKWMKNLPRRNGGELQASTVLRWMLDGLKAANGQRVKLEHVRIGGTLCTSEPALVRFFQRLADPNAATTSPTRGKRAHQAATRELAAAGF